MSERNDDFWKAWEGGEQGTQKLQAAFDTSMCFFGLGDLWWELRQSEAGAFDDTFMATNSTDGNEAFFLVSDWFANLECKQKGRLTAATIIHEVLEVLEWPAGVVEAASDREQAPLAHVRVIRHHQLDKLAWILVPHVFPNLDPEEDFFNEQSDDDAGGSAGGPDHRGGRSDG